MGDADLEYLVKVILRESALTDLDISGTAVTGTWELRFVFGTLC